MTEPVDDRSVRGSLFEYVLALWMRRKWVAVLVFAAVFAAVVTFAVWLPDLYRATTTVIVESQNVSEEFVRSSVTAELETRIQTIRQEVTSRARLGDLINRLDLYPDLRKKGVAFDAIVERLRRDIQLAPTSVEQPMTGRGRTIGFAISYSGRDPRVVAQVANVLASFYVVENEKIREGQAARTADFLKAQLNDIKKELDEQESRVTSFNLSHIGELPQQVSANLASLERLNTQLRLNGDNQIRAVDRRERLERQLVDAQAAAAAAPVTPGSVLLPGAEQVVVLRRQLDELRRKYTDQYPEVVRVRTELVTLERQLSERGSASPATPIATAGVGPLDPVKRLLQSIEDTDAELKALKDEDLALRQAVSSYEQRVENVPKRQEEFQALSRDYATTKDRYDTMLKRYEEAQLASSLEQGRTVEQFRILDAAVPPTAPAAPDRLKLLVVGLMFAVGLAVATVVLAEKMDTSFHSVDQLQAFVTIPMLFSIPRILTAADVRRRWTLFALMAVSVVVGLALIVAASRYIATGNEQIARALTRGQA